MNLKGYVSVRSPVPVSVQNLVLREYCRLNGHKLSLSDVEFLTDFKMLDALLKDRHYDGIVVYSMWIMPAQFKAPHGEMHFALENLVYRRDWERIQTLWKLRQVVK